MSCESQIQEFIDTDSLLTKQFDMFCNNNFIRLLFFKDIILLVPLENGKSSLSEILVIRNKEIMTFD